MCTVIVHVPATPGAATRVLAVRDEDPTRPWDRLGPWWPDTHPGVVGVRDARAGGAWLAADPAAGRLAVILNRADVMPDDGTPVPSRGYLVLDAVAGTEITDPRTHGFNLVDVTAGRTRVTMWNGAELRAVDLAPGIHMIAHDDVDDPTSARIIAWRDAFPEPAADDQRWWTAWMDVLERTAEIGPTDDRAIVRDNRSHGYPTLSLLVCAASVTDAGVDVVYGEFDQPGQWNRPALG